MARQDITKNIVKRHGRYYLRKKLHGQAYCIDLHTTSHRAAKAQARAEWADIIAGHARGGIAKAASRRKLVPSLATVAKIYKAAAIGPKPATRKYNLYSLRKPAVEVLGISHDAVEQMRVDEVANVDILSRWIKHREAGRTNPKDLNTERIYIEGAIKHARSVFSKRSMDQDFGCLRDFEFPGLKGFMAMPLPEYEKRIYRPPCAEEIGRVIEALPALEQKSPAVFISVLLGIGVGLRRGEILAARWSMIEWLDGNPTLVLGATHDWEGTKGKQERRVEIAPSVYRKLIEHKGNDTYLVPDKRGKDASLRPKDSRTKKRTARGAAVTSPDSYRTSTSGSWGLACDCGKWLKSVGWTRRQKLHEMRKYFGAVVSTEAGIYAAKELLGHQDIRTTRDSYAGLVERVQFTDAMDSALKLKTQKKPRKARVA